MYGQSPIQHAFSSSFQAKWCLVLCHDTLGSWTCLLKAPISCLEYPSMPASLTACKFYCLFPQSPPPDHHLNLSQVSACLLHSLLYQVNDAIWPHCHTTTRMCRYTYAHLCKPWASTFLEWRSVPPVYYARSKFSVTLARYGIQGVAVLCGESLPGAVHW